MLSAGPSLLQLPFEVQHPEIDHLQFAYSVVDSELAQVVPASRKGVFDVFEMGGLASENVEIVCAAPVGAFDLRDGKAHGVEQRFHLCGVVTLVVGGPLRFMRTEQMTFGDRARTSRRKGVGEDPSHATEIRYLDV